ncbi:Uncharacterised protein [Providencia stuartii]|nr:Uncharacterised protein [Providencia stuartii]
MDVKLPTDEELKEFILNKYLEEQIKSKSDLYVENYNKRAKQAAENHKKKLMKVTPELFFQFLAEKGFSAKCVSCGSSELSVPESGFVDSEKVPDKFSSLDENTQRSIMEDATTSYVSYISFEKKPENVVGLTKSYYRMHCLNCGHLSLYRSSTVLKWLERKEGQGE